MMISGAVLIFKGAFPSVSNQVEEQLHIIPELPEPVSEELQGVEAIPVLNDSI
ncbi:hypothetical protein JCM19298_2915 [Nonlabens ulvanivorans]|nr:hypothetical protein JCM19298_2915 [Nonlabens ulvanivorans]